MVGLTAPTTTSRVEQGFCRQIRTGDWSRYNTWSGWEGEEEIPFISVERSVAELTNLQKRALRAFFPRPGVVWKSAKIIRSVFDL